MFVSAAPSGFTQHSDFVSQFTCQPILSMTRIAFPIVFASILLAGCGSGESPQAETPERETPAQALHAIIQLYEARDFDSLIRTRYAEIAKAENEAQIVSLVDRFKSTFQNEDTLKEGIATYQSALEITPELSEDGRVATFKLDGGFIKLSRMADAKWGFHL